MEQVVGFKIPCPLFLETTDQFIDCFALIKSSQQLVSGSGVLHSGISFNAVLSSLVAHFIRVPEGLSRGLFQGFFEVCSSKSLALSSFNTGAPLLLNKFITIKPFLNSSFYLSTNFFLLSATMLASERSFSNLDSYGF